MLINAPHPRVFARELRENPAQQKASQYMLLFRSPQAEAVLSADAHQALRLALGDVWDKRFSGRGPSDVSGSVVAAGRPHRQA